MKASTPLAATRAIRTRLTTAEAPRSREDRRREIVSPGAPRVPTGDDEEAMADVQTPELVRERDVLPEAPVAVARVEPQVGSSPAQAWRHGGGVGGRAVVGGGPVLAPEERQGVVRG